MSERQVTMHRDAGALARAVAKRLALTLIEATAGEGRPFHLSLTGGRAAGAVLHELQAAMLLRPADFELVHVWWSDERYLPFGDAARNDTAALDAWPLLRRINPLRVHRWAEPGRAGSTAQSAALMATELDKAGVCERGFDVTLLSLGEDGHVASLFPGSPLLDSTQWTAGVEDAPKPPPQRTTFTLRTVNFSREVWVMATGADKAPAVQAALEPDAVPGVVPGALVRGFQLTRWNVDAAAAQG